MNTRAMIEKSFVDKAFNCSKFWNVIPLQTALNSSVLETAYSEKKLELLSEGRTEEEIEDKILFGCSRTFEEVENISRTGLQVGTKSMNVVLGNALKGVSLGKNADVFLRSCYKDGLESCWIIVYKVTLGRVKGVLPIQTPPYREPAVDADCHCSFIAPSTDDELRIQEAKSQVYIYERHELHRLRPRQCVPFAVAMFTRIGSVMSGVDLTWRHEDTTGVVSTAAAAGSVEQTRRLGGLNALQLPPSVGSVTAAACTPVDAVSLPQNGRSPKTNGVVPAAGTTTTTRVRPVQNEAANGCTPQKTSPGDSRSPFASVTSVFLDSLVKNTPASNYNPANDPRCRTNQSRTSVRQQQQQQPSAQPRAPTKETSLMMQQENSTENPRAQCSHLIRSKLKPTSRDPRSKSNAEAAGTPPGDVVASGVRPSAVENVRPVPNVPVSTTVNFASSNSVPSQIVLLQHQHQLVSDITRQLSADLNTVANFLRATKPENIDAEEMTALQSMQDINAAFQRLTPVCVKYRRFCQSTFDTSSASVLSASVDVSLLPDPSCLLRQDIRLRQCRDGLRQIFDYRRRLMMLTVRAAEQRTLTFNWLRQHSPSITQCIGWLIQVLGEVFDRGVTAGHTAAAAVAAAATVSVLLELSASHKAATAAGSEQRASRQTSSEKQMKLTVEAPTRNFEARGQQLAAIPSSHNISAAHQPQRIVTTTTANNVQAADVQSLTPHISQQQQQQQQQQQLQQQQASLISDQVPVTSLPSPPVALSLVKTERTTTNAASATPPRSARPETIIFDADDVSADAAWPPTAALDTSVDIQGSLSAVGSNSSFVSELLPPCLTPTSMKQDLCDVNNDDAPPVLLPCNQSLTAKPSTDSDNVSTTGSGVTSSRPTTAAVEESGTGVSSGLSGLSSSIASSSLEENTKLLEPGTTENISSTDAAQKRAPTPYPRGTDADQCDDEQRDTTAAAQNNNNNNQNNEEQAEEQEEDVCKEQPIQYNTMRLVTRPTSTERDQKTFSRLLIDSVCSMPADQFSRVREMLIRTLVERRQLAQVAAASATADGPSTSVTVEQRTSTSGSDGEVKNVDTETDANRELNLKIENVFSCDVYNGSTVGSDVVGAAAAAVVVVVNSHVLEDDTKDTAARIDLKWMSLTDADNCDVSDVSCLQNPTGFGSGSGSGVNVHNYITIEPEDDGGHEMQLPVSDDAGDSKLPVANEHQTSQMFCGPMTTQSPRSNVDGSTDNTDVSQPFLMFMSERQHQLIQQQIRHASPEMKMQSTDVSLSVENRSHLPTSPDQLPVCPTVIREVSCADCTPQVFPSGSVHLSPNGGAREPVRSPLATRSDNAAVQQLQQQPQLPQLQLQSIDCGNRSASHETAGRINDQRPSWLPRHRDESLPPDELPVVRGAPPLRAPPRVADHHQQPVYYQSLTMSVSGGHAAELCRNFVAMSKFLRGEEAVRLNAADATRERERLERDSFSRVSRSFGDERPHDVYAAATRVKPDADAIQPRQAAVADDDQKRFPVSKYFRNEVNREAGGGHGALYSDQRSRRSPVNVSDRRSVTGRRTGSPDGSTQRPNVIDYRKIYIRSSPNYRGRPYGPEIARYRGAPPCFGYRERKLSEEHQLFRRRTHRRVSSRSPGTDGYESDGSGRAFKRARSNNSKMSDSPGRSSRGLSLETNEGPTNSQFLSGFRSSRTSDEMIYRSAPDSSKTAARTLPPVDVLDGKQRREASYDTANVVKSPTLSDRSTVTDDRRHFYHSSSRRDGRSTRSTSRGSRAESRDRMRGEVRRKSRSRSRSGRRSLSKRDDRLDSYSSSRQRSPDRTRRRRSRSRSRDYRKHGDVVKSRSKDCRVSSAERNCRREVDGGDGSGAGGDVVEGEHVDRRSRLPGRGNVSESSDQQGNVTCANGRPTVTGDNNCHAVVACEHATNFTIRSPSRICDAPGVQSESSAEQHEIADIVCAEPVVIPTEHRADVAANIDDVTTVPSSENVNHANQAEQRSNQSAVTPRRQRARMQECVIQLSSDDENPDVRCAQRNEDGSARILTAVTSATDKQRLDSELDSPPVNLDRVQQRPRTPLQLAVSAADVSPRSATTSRRSDWASSPPGPESPIQQRHESPSMRRGSAAVELPGFPQRNVVLSTSQQFVRTKTEPGLPVAADDNEDGDCISLLSPTDPPPSCQSEDSAIMNQTRNFVSPLFTYSHQRNVDQSVRLFSDVSGQCRVDAATGAVSSKSLGDAGGGVSGHGKDRPVVFLVTGLTRKPVTQTSTSPGSGQRNDASVADSR